MASKCDYTNTDGTVNQALIEAARNDPSLGTFELVDLESAFQDGTAVSGCSGGRAGKCDYTASDGSVSDSQISAARAAANGDRLGTFALTELEDAYGGGGVVSDCAPAPDESTVSVTDVTTSASDREITVNASMTNTITSGSGETLTRSIGITIDGALAGTDNATLSPGASTEITATITQPPGTYEVCVDIL